MKHSFWLSIALGAGWLLSPESLVIAGNSAGNMGWLAIPALAAVALLFALTGSLIKQSLATENSSDFLLLSSLTGTIPAICLTIVSCLPLVTLAATALLVSSGYTFNEVFLYWFPNFGFSFLLLGLLSILQAFPEKIILRAQIIFVLLAAGGLFLLTVVGIAGAEQPGNALLQKPDNVSAASSALLLLLFTGSRLSGGSKQSFLIPAIAFVLFSFWMFASLSYVNPERLGSSTIPYMTAARKIMGDPGRQIMGLIIISGTSAAITGLLIMCRSMLGAITVSPNTKSLFSVKKQRYLLPPLVALATGILMARGLAGDDLLEILLHGALILWLIHHSLLALSAVILIQKRTGHMPIAGVLSTAILIGGVLFLITTSPQRTETIRFITSMLGAGGLLAAIWYLLHKKLTPEPTTQQTEKSL